MKRLIYKLLLYANVLAVIALVLSYLSAYISPASLWIFAFIGLVYPYLLLLNILFCLLWILRKKKEFLLSLLAILIGWNNLTNQVQMNFGAGEETAMAIQSDRQTRNDQQQIKLMSFNIRAFNLYNWTNNTDDLNKILGFIQDEDPDIICLQEFFTQRNGTVSKSDLLKKFDNTPYNHIHYTLGSLSNNQYGIATFSSYPILNQGTIEFENTLNTCIYTDILFGQDTLRVYNNHLQSIRLSRKNYSYLDSLRFRYNEQQINEIKDISYRLKDAYIKRARQTEKIYDHISASPYQVMICGDFNDPPSSYTYRKLKNGFTDSFVAAGSGFGATYAGRFPSFRIDYILHDTEIRSVYHKRTRIGLSDHYPIISYLELN